MAGQWVAGPGGKPVYQDANGLVHVKNFEGKVEALHPNEAAKFLGDQLSGYAPASAEDLNQAHAEAAWEKASGAEKADFYARQAGKGLIDTVTLPVRMGYAGAAAVDRALGAKPEEQTMAPAEALSGEQLMEKLEGTISPEQAQQYAAQQREYAQAAPLAWAPGLVGSIAGGGPLSKLGGLAEGAIAGGARAAGAGAKLAGIAGKAAATATEGAGYGLQGASEDAWVNADPLTVDSALAHMGVGAALGLAAHGAVSAAGAVPGKLAEKARAVFGGARKTAEEALEARGQLTNEAIDGLAKDVVGTDPPPGFAGKFRDALAWVREKVEQGQSLTTGVKKETLEKYGALRNTPEAMSGRELLENRPEILRKSSEDLIDSLKVLHENGEKIHEEMSNMELKRANVAPLLTGDHEAMMAAASDKAAQLQEGLERLDEVNGPRGQRIFGKGEAIADIRNTYESTIHDVLRAKAPEDAVIALDKFKRKMQRAKVNAGAVVRNAKNELGREQAMAREQLALQVSEDMRSFLQDQNIWGKFGQAQEKVNGAFQRMIDGNDLVAGSFFERTGTQSGVNFGRPRYEVAPSKVQAFINKLGTLDADTPNKFLRANIEARKELGQAIVNLYGISSKEAALKQLVGAADKAKQVLEHADKTAATSNYINEIIEKEKGSHWAGSKAPVVGAAVGGALASPLGLTPVGAALGSLAGHVLSSPGSMIHQSLAIRQIAQRMQTKIADSVGASLKAPVGRVAGRLGGAVRAAAPRSVQVFSPAQQRAENREKTNQYVAAVTRVTEAASDPVRQSSAIANAVGSVGTQGMRDALIAKSATVTSFLASKVPAPLYSQSSPLSGKKLEAVSATDRTKFMEYYEAALHPMGVLDDLKTGTASPQQIETLKTVYPGLYGQVQLEVFKQLQEHGEDLPYQKRLQLSELFDVKSAVEPTLDPAFMQRLEQSAAAVANSNQNLPHPPNGKAPDVASPTKGMLESMKMRAM